MRSAPNHVPLPDRNEPAWEAQLAPFTAAERLFIHRLSALTGCTRSYAAFQARQRSYGARSHALGAIVSEAGYVERSRWGRIPVALADRINQKRERRGLAPMKRSALACPLTRFHPWQCQ